jgi:cell division protein FtsI/penicillin-binding protein 2
MSYGITFQVGTPQLRASSSLLPKFDNLQEESPRQYLESQTFSCCLFWMVGAGCLVVTGIYLPHMTPLRICVARTLLLIIALSGARGTAQARDASARLDRLIAQHMAGKSGAVVVMEVASGRIVAQWNPRVAALRVRAPGSTVKPFVLLELLRLGKLDPQQHMACHRSLTIAGRHMDCTHSPAVTDLDAADAIAYSCNTYFAAVSTRLTADELFQALVRTGFRSSTGLGRDEAVGRMRLAADQDHLQLQALGYWGVEVTPLELLFAYRSLAQHKLNNDLPEAGPVFSGLEHAVQYGMAHEAEPAGITAAGKTGTAAGTASPQAHGLFVGYAPAEKPEIALVVYLENGRGRDAAAIAAPVFTAFGKANRSAGVAR